MNTASFTYKLQSLINGDRLFWLIMSLFFLVFLIVAILFFQSSDAFTADAGQEFISILQKQLTTGSAP